MDTVHQGGAVTRGGVRRGGGEGLIILTVTRLQVLCPDTPGVNYLVWPGESKVLQNGYYCNVLPLL